MSISKTLITVFCFLCISLLRSQCGPGTPQFTANLSASPSATYISPVVQRNDTCCGAQAPDVCIKFTIILHPNAVGINFSIASGAVPPGALFYQIACGPLIAVGQPICLNGPGPHILTFCKPGNNQNTYMISSIPGPVIPDSISVRNGCSATLAVTGYSIPTVSWNSINPAPVGAYNSYLSCTTGCQTVVVTPTGTPPAFVDYEVSGFLPAPCQSNFHKDTVRVYFYNDLIAAINPSQTTICFGSNTAVLTCTATGGKPPLTYSWSTGSTVQTVTVGPGTYTCWVDDATDCPPTLATAVVNQFTLPISANAGPDQTRCKTSPNAILNGTIVMAGGGIWSGGSGTITPSNTVMNITYIPTPAEVTTGSVLLTLTSTSNQGCPGASDNVVIFFQNPPLANAGLNPTVCANNSTVNLSGAILNFSASPLWVSSGTGSFTSPTSLNTSYIPSAADIANGGAVLTLSTTNNGACPASTSTVPLTITPSPTVSAGASQTICSTGTISLNGNVSGPTSTGFWVTTGDGFFSPSSNQPTTSYIPGPNDIASGNVNFTLTSSNNGNCFPVSNTVSIGIAKIATVNAGPTQAICANTPTLALTGSVSGVSSTGFWTSNGTGGYNPGPTFLNNTYFISGGDIANGSVTFTLTSTNNGPCPAVADTVMISIVPLAQINSGTNQFICASQGTIALSGTATPVGSSWSGSGSGAYFPNNFVTNPVYSLTPADIAAGFVTFTLSSLVSGPCPVVRDSMRVNIRQMAVVNAGPNQQLCSNAGATALSGSVTIGTTTGFWTSNGTGGYTPGAGFLNTTYLISAGDVAAGSVIFTLTSTNNGPCPSVADTVMISIIQLPQVNAGPNQFICANQGAINLSGTVTPAGGMWTGSGSGPYSPSNLITNPSYSLTAADIAAGFVTFTLSSLPGGPCPIVSDSVRVNVRQLAQVDAGPNQQLCSSTGLVTLSGSVTAGTTTGFWSSSGTGGYNPGPGFLNGNYFFTSTDIALGSVTFTLSSTNNGPCPTVSDTVMISIISLAQVNAGPNQLICENQGTIALSGTVSTGNAMWTASGPGVFSPTITSLAPSYSLTAADIAAGFVTFTLSSTNNGPCPVINDTTRIGVRRIAVVNAGPDRQLCTSSSHAALSGSVSVGSTTGLWTTLGSGNFLPAATTLSASYAYSSADVQTRTISLVLTSLNNGICPAVSDTMNVVIFSDPVINIQSDTTICSYQNPVEISAGVAGNYGQLLWSSSATTGSFIPNIGTNPVKYKFGFTEMSMGTVTLTIALVNNGPCGNKSGTVRVDIRPAPIASFVASAYTVATHKEPISFTNQSQLANTYVWDFGDGNQSNQVHPVHKFPAAGYYTVQLIATNQYNCIDTTDQLVVIKSDIQFPNVFTPNLGGSNGGVYDENDYSNDVFFPYTSGVIEYDLKIFNRYGELVFESNDVKRGWDGYFNGKLSQQDGYVWKANVIFFDGRTYQGVGSVVLLR